MSNIPFKKRLKAVAMRVRRLYRLARFGDTEQVAHFERSTPEVMRSKSRNLIRRVLYVLQEMAVSLKRAHVRTMKESRVLIPDLLQGEANGAYGKYTINNTYKNAFSLSVAPKGTLMIRTPPDAEGVYFFMGRQAAGTPTGDVEIRLNDGSGWNSMKKAASALGEQWELYRMPFTSCQDVSVDKLKMEWCASEPDANICISTPVIQRRRPPRTVVVLIADAVRPSDLNKGFTPNIDEFFRDGLTFKESYAQSDWTLPAFASMATSRYASDHHVVDPDAYSRAMNREDATLAELMRLNGYYTFGSVSHRRCNQALGHHRGYDHFDYATTFETTLTRSVFSSNNMYRQQKQLCESMRALEAVDYFAFVHYFDTHYPYLRNAYYPSSFKTSATQPLWWYLQRAVRAGADEEAHAAIYEQYYATLREFDHQVGMLLDLLNRRERTTVIFTSDHGHSYVASEGRLSDDRIRTAFMMRSNEFDLRGDATSRMVESSVDLLPTISALYRFKDVGQRSGTAIFDSEGQIVPKDFAVSELVYLDRYQIKLIGRSGSRIIFEAPRDRKSCRIHLNQMKVRINEEESGVPMESIRVMHEHVQSARLNDDIKKRMYELIQDVQG